MASVAVADEAMVPIAQTPLVLLYVPWLAVAETKVTPAGNWSVRVTPVAASGPVFRRVIVKVIWSPTLGVGLLTAFVTARSACCGVSVAVAVLFPANGSN